MPMTWSAILTHKFLYRLWSKWTWNIVNLIGESKEIRHLELVDRRNMKNAVIRIQKVTGVNEFLSYLQGNLKVKKELPSQVTVFSQSSPNTTNQHIGRRIKSAPANAMQRLERLTNYRLKRNKELFTSDWCPHWKTIWNKELDLGNYCHYNATT